MSNLIQSLHVGKPVLYAACCMRTTSRRRVLREPTSPDSRARIRCLYLAAIGFHELPCQQDRVACELPQGGHGRVLTCAHAGARGDEGEDRDRRQRDGDSAQREPRQGEGARKREGLNSAAHTVQRARRTAAQARTAPLAKEKVVWSQALRGPCLADVLGLVTPQHCDEVKGVSVITVVCARWAGRPREVCDAARPAAHRVEQEPRRLPREAGAGAPPVARSSAVPHRCAVGTAQTDRPYGTAHARWA